MLESVVALSTLFWIGQDCGVIGPPGSSCWWDMFFFLFFFNLCVFLVYLPDLFRFSGFHGLCWRVCRDPKVH